MGDRSCLLFARPSAVAGTASILDFGDTLTEYNTSLSPEQADYLAAWADWLAVGECIYGAMNMLEEGGTRTHRWPRTPSETLTQ